MTVYPKYSRRNGISGIRKGKENKKSCKEYEIQKLNNNKRKTEVL
jgi:hypothetical protein